MKLLRPVTLSLIATLLIGFSSSAMAATITASPGTVAPGGSETVAWSAIASPTNKDWVGLYAQNAGNTSFRDWVYVSCSKTPGGAFTNGSCSFGIPANTPVGTYQFRLFANDGFTLLATSNNFTVATTPPPPPVRFVDNNDGTISDLQTGLMWERKTGTVGTLVSCSLPTDCPDPHNVNNLYRWSLTTPRPDGPLFTDFLASINRADGASSDGQNQDRKNYSDWRIPTIAELRGILLAQFPACPSNPCIDPVFGPTADFFYWSSTSLTNPLIAYSLRFSDGLLNADGKNDLRPVRAVRGGR